MLELRVSDQEKVPAESSQQAGVVADRPAQAVVNSDVPDGGWTAWSVVVGGWCAMFVSVGWNTAAGVFQTIYQKDFLQNYSPSAIGWIISLQTFFMFVSAPITGKAFDSYGPRWIIAFGSTLQVLAFHPVAVNMYGYRWWRNLLRCFEFYRNVVQE
jgi:hypothetical protein